MTNRQDEEERVVRALTIEEMARRARVLAEWRRRDDQVLAFEAVTLFAVGGLATGLLIAALLELLPHAVAWTLASLAGFLWILVTTVAHIVAGIWRRG